MLASVVSVWSTGRRAAARSVRAAVRLRRQGALLGLLAAFLVGALAALTPAGAPASARSVDDDFSLAGQNDYQGNLAFWGDGDGDNGEDDVGSAKHHSKNYGSWNLNRIDNNGTPRNIYDDGGYQRKQMGTCADGDNTVIYLQKGYDCILFRHGSNTTLHEDFKQWAQMDRSGRVTTSNVLTIYVDWDNDGSNSDQAHRLQAENPGTAVFWVGGLGVSTSEYKLKTVIVLDDEVIGHFNQEGPNAGTDWTFTEGTMVPFSVSLLGSAERYDRSIAYEQTAGSGNWNRNRKTEGVTWGWHRTTQAGHIEPLGFDAVSFEIFVIGPGHAVFRQWSGGGINKILGTHLRGNDPDLYDEAGSRAASLLRPLGPTGNDVDGYKLGGATDRDGNAGSAGRLVLDTSRLPSGEYEIVLRVQYADTSNWLTTDEPRSLGILTSEEVIRSSSGEVMDDGTADPLWSICALRDGINRVDAYTPEWDRYDFGFNPAIYRCDDGITPSPTSDLAGIWGPEMPVPSHAVLHFAQGDEFKQKFLVVQPEENHLDTAQLTFTDGEGGLDEEETEITAPGGDDVYLRLQSLTADERIVPVANMDWVKIQAFGAEIYTEEASGGSTCHDDSSRRDWSSDIWTSDAKPTGIPRNGGANTLFCLRSRGGDARTFTVEAEVRANAAGGGGVKETVSLTVHFTGPAAVLTAPDAVGGTFSTSGFTIGVPLTAVDSNDFPAELRVDPDLHVTVRDADGLALANVGEVFEFDLIATDDARTPGVNIALPAGTAAGHYTATIGLRDDDGNLIAASAATTRLVVAGSPSQVVVTLDQQSGYGVGSIITATAQVQDSLGTPVTGQDVLFTTTAGLMRIGAAPQATDGDGNSSQSYIILEPSIGGITARAGYQTDATTMAVSGGVSGYAVVMPAGFEAAAAAGVEGAVTEPEEEVPTGVAALSSKRAFSSYDSSIPSQASVLYETLARRGASSILLWNGRSWIPYAELADGSIVPGARDFEVRDGDVLWISY